MRVIATAVAIAALALGGVAAVSAQPPAPTVTVTASETTLDVGVSGPLAPGPTRFEIVETGGEDLEIAIGALRPGVTLDQFTTALRSGDANAAIERVSLDGGASLSARNRRRVVTSTLGLTPRTSRSTSPVTIRATGRSSASPPAVSRTGRRLLAPTPGCG